MAWQLLVRRPCCAAFIAFVYTSCLLAEWVWKKLIKPVLIERGIIKISRIIQVSDDANK